MMVFPMTPFSPHYRTVRAADTWWNGSWDYRKSFNVTGQATTETNYQIEIIVHRKSGTDSGNVVYVDTDKMQSDYDDLRYTNDEASPTSLDYWIEWKNTTMARTWVELDSITASSTDIFYMYYDNTGASSVSNGTLTFPTEFQDFDTDDAYYTGTSVRIDDGGDERVEWATSSSYGDGEESTPLATKAEFTLDFIVYWSSMSGFSGTRIMFGDTLQTTWGLGSGWDAAGVQFNYSGNFVCYAVENGVGDTSGGASQFSTGTTYYTRVTYDDSTLNATIYSDYWDTKVSSYQVSSVSWSDNLDTLTYQSRDRLGAAGWVDDARIRHWVSEDPNAANWGSEEQANQTPAVDADADCTNDDSTYLYAQYRKYKFTANVSDADGYADIDYVEMTFNSSGNFYTVRYDEDTNTFSEQLNPTYFDLDGDSTATRSGNDIDITFVLLVAWVCPAYSAFDVNVTVIDAGGLSATDFAQTNLNIGKYLSMYGVTVDDGTGTSDRGTAGGTVTVSGYVNYTATTLHPDDIRGDLVDVWTTGVAGADGSDTTLSSGQFSLTITSGATVGDDAFYLKVVANGGGQGGTNLMAGLVEDNYISDLLNITVHAPTYTRLPLSTNMSGVTYTAVYQHDSLAAEGVGLNVSTWSYAVDTSFTVSFNVTTDTQHGVSGTPAGEFTATWTDISSVDGTFWTRQTETSVFAHITIGTIQYSAIATNVPDGAYVAMYHNGTLFANVTVSSNAAFKLQDYANTWDAVEWTFTLTYISAPVYFINYTFYTTVADPPNINTLYVEVFSMELDDYYINIYWETNWHNSTCFIFKDDVYQSNVTLEGFAQIAKPTTAGTYEYTFIFNSTDGAASGEQDPAGSDANKWALRTRNVQISLTANIVLRKSNGETIAPERFQIWVAGDLLNAYFPSYTATTDNVNITVYDEFWDKIVYQDTSYVVTTRIMLTIDCHDIIIVNQMDYAIYAIITYNSIEVTISGIYTEFEITVFSGSYTVQLYRERDDHEVAFMGTDGEWTGSETATVNANWVIITRKVEYPEDDPPVFPVSVLLSDALQNVLIIFIGILALSLWRSKRRERDKVLIIPPQDKRKARKVGKSDIKDPALEYYNDAETAHDKIGETYDALLDKND
jgi:hypothetical protein